MQLQMNLELVKDYTSNSQKARVLSENWTLENIFCPNCGAINLNEFGNNKEVADFFCSGCKDEYELKSKKGKVPSKITDGAYLSMIKRLNSATNPNLFFLSYSADYQVTDFLAIPKYFFTPEVIEKRKPLASTAKRAGWTGCNILFHKIPKVGIINIIIDGQILPKQSILNQWQKTLFMQGTKDLKARSWLLDIVLEIEKLGQEVFKLEDIYKSEATLAIKHPGNNHIRDKIRQQLQVLRDRGYLVFLERGVYQVV